MKGRDILASAKTGTGKTLGFLVPAAHSLLQRPPKGTNNVSVLVLSPTRELAMQIRDAAVKLVEGTGLGVQCVVGGTNVNSEASKLANQRCDFLVATPGRLIDHLGNARLNLPARLGQLRTFVLDEADRMLDQGFRPALNEIIAFLPDRKVAPRQVLLFSATVSAEVRKIAALVLAQQHDYVSTIAPEDVNTHEKVPQSVLEASIFNVLPALLLVIRREMALDGDRCKLIIFSPTARAADINHQAFERLNLGLPMWAIHSRKSQSTRTKATEAFRMTTKGIVFSSDVLARGIDIPGISGVIQVGQPSDADQYVHRIGRTGRAGASGRGTLILTPPERTAFMRQGAITRLPIEPYPALPPQELQQATTLIKQALAGVDDDSKAQAYQAWLGYYKGNLRAYGWSCEELIHQAENYARSLEYGGPGAPPLFTTTIGKMGLKPYKHLLNAVPDTRTRGGR